ncbi:sensor histidine kinase [Deinococcus sp.]|uniref:sensor histidine kinase n=1 Tax=Deinococcus sp. TaxID=47478 RepID=UPI003CC6AC84
MNPDLDDLRRIEALDGLSESELGWIAAHTEVRDFQDGGQVVRAGDAADHLFFLFEGQVEYTGELSGQPVHYVTRRGEVAGMLPHSLMTHFASAGRARGPTRMGWLHRDHFGELAQAVPSLDARLLAVMTRRIRDATHAQEQAERLRALGKLSAGLAHELNNPVAAVRRDAADLALRLGALPELLTPLLSLPGGAGAALLEQADAAVAAALARAETLSAMQRLDAEDEVLELLEDLKVPRAAERAATLVEGGLTRADLQALLAWPQEPVPLIAYLDFRLGGQMSLRHLQSAAGRISELVASIKRYSFMDRGGDWQPTDVRTGLSSTLTMLGHKLRSQNVRVNQDFAADLPSVEANEGELNQVWTNLIDNALDAMPQGGTLSLKASAEAGHLLVRVQDTGPGIPADIQMRIFEPFFTTKAVGEGSGLGLDMVQRIVVRQHGGEVRVSSQPGQTEFLVSLPRQAARPASLPAST